MGAPLTQSQAADLIGVTTRRLRQMSQEENPPPQREDGQYEARAFGEWLRQRALADVGIGEDGTAYKYANERARLTFHQANIAELDEAVKRGELIAADDALSEWTAMIGNARGMLLSLPGRLATMAIGATDLREIEEFTREEIHRALSELSTHAADTEESTAGGDAQLGAAAEVDG